MTFFSTFFFEIVIYILFFITIYIAINRHGKNVLFLFLLIVAIAYYIEVGAISREGYDYLGFSIYIEGYPFCLPLGWIVFFFWAHTLAEGFIHWDGSLFKALSLALMTGIITGTISFFLEPAGQALGWWEYYSEGIWGMKLFDIPVEIYTTYLSWGFFDGVVFRTSMKYGFIQRKDWSPPLISLIPYTCYAFFFGLMVFAVSLEMPELIVIWIGNVFLYPFVAIFRLYDIEFKEKGMTLSTEFRKIRLIKNVIG